MVIRLPHRVLSARAWWRACAAFALVMQVAADAAAAMPHPGDLVTAPATLESHHTAQCVRMHDAARCAVCQYQATRPLPTALRRIQLATRVTGRIGSHDRPRAVMSRSRLRTTPPRAPPPSHLI